MACGCRGARSTFEVRLSDGTVKEVTSESEARTLVRISGGSYSKKT